MMKANEPTKPFSGGCACGAIRYECTADPVAMVHCHCRDCQLSSGGPFASYVVVPADGLRLHGSLRVYATPSEMGGKTHRGFCGECGSPVQAAPDQAPGIVAIRTATLDDSSWFVPQLDAWTSDAQPWDHFDAALPKFDRYGAAPAQD